jgi:shikimate kinase
VLKEVLRIDNVVISTGGGLPCFNNNMELIRHNALSFYIELPVKMLHQRLISAKKKRPLMQNKSVEELLDYLEKTLQTRSPFYNRADYKISHQTEYVFQFISEAVKKHTSQGID